MLRSRCVVWSADTGAYLVGSTVGGPKMSPTISPGKTWSGLAGGIAAAALAGAVTAQILGTNAGFLALLSAFVGAVSQAGDLAESWAKRRFGVKDMGRTVPGHGGLFDRVDGLLAATLPVAAISTIEKGGILTWT